MYCLFQVRFFVNADKFKLHTRILILTISHDNNWSIIVQYIFRVEWLLHKAIPQ